ncbi:MAG TPA: response regulator [Candidatus Omnitrophota bacterium]|nr:response regulator [Candidatus Omnitrophota bacterium]
MPETAVPPNAAILVVDDQPAMREVVRDVLEITGCRVTEAASAESAKALIAQQPVQVVVTDIFMDGTRPTGVELIDHIRRTLPGVRIVAVSGGGSDALRVAAEHGADAILTKPFSAQELLRAVAGSA